MCVAHINEDKCNLLTADFRPIMTLRNSPTVNDIIKVRKCLPGDIIRRIGFYADKAAWTWRIRSILSPG